MEPKKELFIFALAAQGQGISGSDRIFIEFARRWSRNALITIYLSREGAEMCRRQGLANPQLNFRITKTVNYFARIVEGIKIALTLKITNDTRVIMYSASEFWMDSLPACILKIRYPKIRWVAAWFQTAPNPLVGFTESKGNTRYRFKSLIYFLVQFPIKPLISRFADFVLVNNEDEKKQFPGLNKTNKALVVQGAINIQEIKKWRLKFKNLPKIYECVFQGRFHPQKGVLELIDIWRLVVSKRKNAKLIMIGDGPLMKSVRLKIKSEKLEDNIELKGYLFDGEEKYRVFAQSKVVLHPAFFDSGGMASAEAMAFGLPCVGFDLSAYLSYYPHGMVKVPIGNLEKFAGKILELLSDTIFYTKIVKEALDMIDDSWSWQKRADDILETVIK